MHTCTNTYTQDNIKIPKDKKDNDKNKDKKDNDKNKDNKDNDKNKDKKDNDKKEMNHHEEDIARTDSAGKKHPLKNGPSFRSRLMSVLHLNPVIPGAKGLQG
jgi:hypothetical protein